MLVSGIFSADLGVEENLDGGAYGCCLTSHVVLGGCEFIGNSSDLGGFGHCVCGDRVRNVGDL